MIQRVPGLRAVVAIAFLLGVPGVSGAAQTQQPPRASAEAPPASPVVLDHDAGETRENFEALLKRLPPEVGRVMRIDPSVMRNATYLAPYPTLAAFLQQHPEVIQNPSFYLEHINYEFWNPRQPEDPQSRAFDAFRDLIQAIAMLSGFSIFAFGITWIIRTGLEYRRWSRMAKVQTEVHGKLLDRLTSNEDLIAYMQTSAGRRFLESAPIVTDGPARSLGAPVSRILWSLQVGVVLLTAGLGILFVSGRVVYEIAQVVFGVGVLVLAVGAGFVISAVASFLLSRRLGLLEPAPPGPREHTGLTGV